VTENEDGTVTLTMAEYVDLDNDAMFLQCLQNGGVDNWSWYHEAYKEFEAWKKENGRE
jgi:hypothetical protein